MSFAVIRTGGKQYKITAGASVYIDRLPNEVGDNVTFDDVLLHSDKPTDGLSLGATVVRQIRTRKVLVFKKHRRQNYRRKNGHRQYMTLVRFDTI